LVSTATPTGVLGGLRDRQHGVVVKIADATRVATAERAILPPLRPSL